MFDNIPGDKALEILSGLAKDIYGDMASPAIKQIGHGAANAVKLVLLPLTLTGETVDVAIQKYRDFLIETFQKVPENKLVSPSPRITMSVIQNVLHAFDEESIREIYSNLLASASHKDDKCKVHPSFPFIISQLDSVDVTILNKLRSENVIPFMETSLCSCNTSGLPFPVLEPFSLIPGYENNYPAISISFRTLSRLGLIEKVTPVASNEYDAIYQSPIYDNIRETIKELEKLPPNPDALTIKPSRGCFHTTTLGTHFLDVCISRPDN